MTTLTKDTVALFLSTVTDGEAFDTEDTDAVKAAIRQITGAKKVSAALVASFIDFVEQIEDGESNGRSIVKKSYKRAYKPFKNTCGDEFAHLIRQTIEMKVEGSNKTVVDPDRLYKLAVANGVWRKEYKDLNVGQQRMNIGNRLRAMAKRDEQIVWSI